MRIPTSARRVKTTDTPGAEGHVCGPVEGERIIRVVKRSDDDFERLTSCSRWYLPLG